jgi:hypothetical protein
VCKTHRKMFLAPFSKQQANELKVHTMLDHINATADKIAAVRHACREPFHECVTANIHHTHRPAVRSAHSPQNLTTYRGEWSYCLRSQWIPVAHIYIRYIRSDHSLLHTVLTCTCKSILAYLSADCGLISGSCRCVRGLWRQPAQIIWLGSTIGGG